MKHLTEYIMEKKESETEIVSDSKKPFPKSKRSKFSKVTKPFKDFGNDVASDLDNDLNPLKNK